MHLNTINDKATSTGLSNEQLVPCMILSHYINIYCVFITVTSAKTLVEIAEIFDCCNMCVVHYISHEFV